MNVKKIIKNYLIKNKYDGLYLYDECGCRLDDLMTCGLDCTDCEPGIFGDCKSCKSVDENGKCNKEWDWCITGKNKVKINE